MITNIITQNELDDLTKAISRDMQQLQNQIIALHEQITALANFVGAEPKNSDDNQNKKDNHS